jgi:transcriptional regulator with XRE-family HTH domain
MAISEQIKILMTRTGVKQKYVAEKVGLSAENFNNKLRGERFNREELDKIAAVFGAEYHEDPPPRQWFTLQGKEV